MTELKYHHKTPIYFEGESLTTEMLLTGSTFWKEAFFARHFTPLSLLKLEQPYNPDAARQLQEELGLLPGLCQHHQLMGSMVGIVQSLSLEIQQRKAAALITGWS